MTAEHNKNEQNSERKLLSPRTYLLRLLLVVLALNLFVITLASVLLYLNRLEHLRLGEADSHNLSNVLGQNITGSIGQKADCGILWRQDLG